PGEPPRALPAAAGASRSAGGGGASFRPKYMPGGSFAQFGTNRYPPSPCAPAPRALTTRPNPPTPSATRRRMRLPPALDSTRGPAPRQTTIGYTPPDSGGSEMMVRHASRAMAGAALLVLVTTATVATAAPVRMARHPDYHAGKVTFSYLGDIWMANEDGTGVVRLTDNIAREVYPRFSPDGRWIAFSSDRYGNNDVLIIPASGGAPKRLTYHTGNDEVVNWSRDSQRVLFRAARGDGAFPNVATLYEVSINGGLEQPLPVDWGYWGSHSPDGKSLAFNRHPSVWSRQHYRGSYAADLWIAAAAGTSYTRLLGDERYNRFWPMWGADNAIYFVADPL